MRKILFVTFILLLGFYVFKSEIPSGGSSEQSSLIHSSQVNKHLLDTQLKMDIQRKDLEQSQRELTKEEAAWDQIFSKTKAQIRERKYLSEEELYKQINPEKSQKHQSVADRIQNELFNEDFEKTYDETIKNAIAQEFIKNAHQAGFTIQLDENYRVIRVGKIKQEQPFSLFGQRTPQSEGQDESQAKTPSPDKEPLK
jgi:hypothetical protein